MRFGWVKRILAALVLACAFFAMPFTTLGESEPWYFWVGSGVLAFVVALLLLWIAAESKK